LISPAVTSKWKKGTGGPADDECQNLVTHTLTSEGHDASEDGTGRGTPIVGAFMAGQGAKAGGIGYDEGVSPTLKSAGSGTNQAPTIHGQGVRRLTPTECERLQGFPDGWTIPDETDWREYPKPDGPRYAQMGNAVTVNVAEWIGARLMEVESAIGGPTE
jgi:DNA (cytosine-5)-methyltransferase 1